MKHKFFRWFATPFIALALVLPGISIVGMDQSAARFADTCQTATGEIYLCNASAAPVLSRGDVSSSGVGPHNVAVFDDECNNCAQMLADVLNTDPEVAATALTRANVENGDLAAYSCVATRLLGFGDQPTAATVQAIQNFVAGGGGYVGEWWGAGAALDGPGPSVNGDYGVPARFLGLFSGLASDGDFVLSGNPITVIQNHPVVQGLPNIFSGGGGTEFFVRAIPPFDPDLEVVATYEGHGGTNPAIMAGKSGISNAVLLFFDAIDEPSDVYLRQLWINSVKFACSSPADIQDVSIDIKPGNNHNRIMIGSRGNASVDVAILSKPDFNAPQQVDRNSLTFGATGNENSLRRRFLLGTPDCRARDVNHDRIKDLVCSFLIRQTGFKIGDTVGILKGQTAAGSLLIGRDSVVIAAPSYPSYPSYP